MDLFTYVDHIDNVSLFYYGIIFCLFFVYFRSYPIQLNHFVGILLSFLTIIYLQSKNQKEAGDYARQQAEKLKIIEPETKYLKNYNDFIDLLFSIQDFYQYNPEAFEELVDSVDQFLYTNETIHKDPTLTNSMFVFADKYYHTAMNSLHSFVHTLPTDAHIIEKHHRALEEMEKLFLLYLNKLYDIHQQNELNVDYKLITTGPKAFAYYTDKHFDYF